MSSTWVAIATFFVATVKTPFKKIPNGSESIADLLPNGGMEKDVVARRSVACIFRGKSCYEMNQIVISLRRLGNMHGMVNNMPGTHQWIFVGERKFVEAYSEQYDTQRPHIRFLRIGGIGGKYLRCSEFDSAREAGMYGRICVG